MIIFQVILKLLLGETSNVNNFWYWLHLFLKWTFDSLWVLPLFLLSRIVNALWFQVSIIFFILTARFI